MTCFRFFTQSTFVAGRRWRNLCDRSIMRTDTQPCAEIESPRARVPYIGSMRIFFCDSAAHACAAVEADTFPGRLRPWAAHSPTPRPTTANKKYRSHVVAALPAIPEEPFVTCHPDTNRRDYVDSSLVRTHMQSHAEIEFTGGYPP